MQELIVIGGGAAGFFGAITAGEHGLRNSLILEASPEVLTKVRISGGGRCNVTHHCFDSRELTTYYPRGEKSLLGPFSRFQPEDTITWFAARGVELKVEPDGRVFPVTDSSQTIIDCLTSAAHAAGVSWQTRTPVTALVKNKDGDFEVRTPQKTYQARKVLVATGGIRTKQARLPAEEANHSLHPPVPSLFTFKIEDPRLVDLAGVSVPDGEVRVAKRITRGPILITHWGLSGPGILKLSAWEARSLAEQNYQFKLILNWTGSETSGSLETLFATTRAKNGSWKVMKRSLVRGISRRLWQRLCETVQITPETTWSHLPKEQARALITQLVAAEFEVTGKSLNKDEFVTCGGIPLKEVALKTMESKTVPGLHFAGEVLDIDGITGGFNFQAAWTTGHLAGNAIAESSTR